jgi:CubicO group peptidase (beta-lactamase class C family)
MGGAWASAEDVAHFARALLSDGGALLSKESLSKMTQDRTPTTWGGRHGLGIFIDNSSGSPFWSHSGSGGGFLSSLSVVPSRGLAVVMS